MAGQAQAQATVVKTVRVPPELAQRIREAAEAAGVSENATTVALLAEALAARAKREK